MVQLIRCYQALNEKTLRERCGQVGRTGEVKLLFQLCLGHPFHLAVENRVPALIANIPQTKQKGIVSIQQQNSPPQKTTTTINTVLFPVFATHGLRSVASMPVYAFKVAGNKLGRIIIGSLAHWPLSNCCRFISGCKKNIFRRKKK